jgi:glycosyltransferase involved in cell wall biosynthesis
MNSAERPRVLMPVFNALDYDGRVQRAAQALSNVAEVVVLALDGGRGFAPHGYQLTVVPMAAGEFGQRRSLHLRFLRHLVRTAWRLRPDVVYGHDFFTAFPAWLASKLARARFVYDAHELLVPGSLGSQLSGAKEQFWYRLERAVLPRADWVIAANLNRAEVMARHYGLVRVPTVIRNIPPPPASRLAAAAVLARYPALERRSSSECLCVYQGDMNLERGLGPVVDAFEFLPPDFRLVLVGGGPDLDRVRERLCASPLGRQVSALGRVPRDDLVDMLRLCDIGIVTYSFDGLNNLYCAPNKVFEYAQSGIPIVATGQPSLVELVETTGIGCIAGGASAPSASELASALMKAREDRDRYRSAMPAFLEANRWELEAQRLREGFAAMMAS